MAQKFAKATLTACLIGIGASLFAATAADAAPRRKIYIKNACNRPLQVLVHHADGWRNWHPHAWYQYEPGEGSYVNNSDGEKLTQMDDHDLYMYAETTDDRRTLRWEGGGPEVTWRGATYTTMKMNTSVDRDGDRVVRLTCDN
ncbi:hypothetical protein GTZ99_05865 [Novosphingobium sp. FSY-8]|uniref:Secreted protein n=1 Tax=Novosphingobium ovatum TaxID=1908523 RepID=A0ABW9XC55_9SPHN|nr:hypothetical protein [Novosphingobium ovatum]NBC36082.1 hypothetical protein [Novosphingobium ovatum]